jgi:hypothetical protein
MPSAVIEYTTIPSMSLLNSTVHVEQKYQPGAVNRPTHRFPHSGQMGYFSRMTILLYSFYTNHNDRDGLLVTRIEKIFPDSLAEGQLYVLGPPARGFSASSDACPSLST